MSEERPVTDLLTRLESGSGPDMALSREIMTTIGGWHRVEPRFNRRKGAYISPEEWRGARPDGSPILSQSGTHLYPDTPDPVSSLDAAVALTERLLPDAQYRIERGMSFIWLPDDPEVYEGIGKRPRALCAALVRALDQEPQT